MRRLLRVGMSNVMNPRAITDVGLTGRQRLFRTVGASEVQFVRRVYGESPSRLMFQGK